MGYPDREDERDILNSHRTGQPVQQLEPVGTLQDILNIQSAVREVEVEQSICEYLLDVVHATRQSPQLSVGVSTRGVLLWYRAIQAHALIEGRRYAVPDDAKQLTIPVLSHRVQLHSGIRGSTRDELESTLREIVSQIPLPG